MIAGRLWDMTAASPTRDAGPARSTPSYAPCGEDHRHLAPRLGVRRRDPRCPSRAPRTSTPARPGSERLASEPSNRDVPMLVLVFITVFLCWQIIVRRVTGEWLVRHHEHGMVLPVDGTIGANSTSIIHRNGVVERPLFVIGEAIVSKCFRATS